MTLKSEQVSGAIFLIGLGLLFITGWWFPGMLFVIGASQLGSVLISEGDWKNATGALWLIGLGTIFWLNLPWGFIFILVGLSYLFCANNDDMGWGGKRKNDEKVKNDDYDIV